MKYCHSCANEIADSQDAVMIRFGKKGTTFEGVPVIRLFPDTIDNWYHRKCYVELLEMFQNVQ